jgi:hypothetical protein
LYFYGGVFLKKIFKNGGTKKQTSNRTYVVLLSVFSILALGGLLFFVMHHAAWAQSVNASSVKPPSVYNPVIGFFVAVLTMFLNYIYDFIKSSDIAKSERQGSFAQGELAKRVPVILEPIHGSEDLVVEKSADRDPEFSSSIGEIEETEPEQDFDFNVYHDDESSVGPFQSYEEDDENPYHKARLEEEDFEDLSNEPKEEEFLLDWEDETPIHPRPPIQKNNEWNKESPPLQKEDVASSWSQREEFMQKLAMTKGMLEFQVQSEPEPYPALEPTFTDADPQSKDVENEVPLWEEAALGESDSSLEGDSYEESKADADQETQDDADFFSMDDFEDGDAFSLYEESLDENQMPTEEPMSPQEAEEDFNLEDLTKLYHEMREDKMFEEKDQEEGAERPSQTKEGVESELEAVDKQYNDALYQSILNEYHQNFSQNMNKEDPVTRETDMESEDSFKEVGKANEDFRIPSLKETQRENKDAQGQKRDPNFQNTPIVLIAKTAQGPGEIYENKKEGKHVKVLESEDGFLIFEKIAAKTGRYRLDLYYSALIWSSIDILVNGRDKVVFEIFGDGDIDVLKHSAAEVELKEGFNSIKLSNPSYQNVLVEKIELHLITDPWNMEA